MATERLQHREDDLTSARLDGESFDEVESSVRAGVVFLIEAVEVHDADELLAVDRSFGEVLHVRSDRVVAVHDVQFELIGVDAGCSEGIDILHHQVPRTASFDTGCVGAGFQHLECQRIRRTQFFATIGRELTDLIDLTVVGIFVGNCQDFVLVQRTFQRYISQRGVQAVLAAGQQTCRLHFVEVRAALHAVQALERRARLLDITEIGLTNRAVEVVGVVVRCRNR